jgi:hypothetical protein
VWTILKIRTIKTDHMQIVNDNQLRELAKKRVDFRRHFAVFCIMNSALWLIWWFSGQGYVWPIWPLAGWGVGLLFHYPFEYRPSKFFSEEDEFKKLKAGADASGKV